jgi:hypothetical protein
MYVNYAILDGVLFVKTEEPHIVARLTMFLRKSFKDKAMMTVLTFGV